MEQHDKKNKIDISSKFTSQVEKRFRFSNYILSPLKYSWKKSTKVLSVVFYFLYKLFSKKSKWNKYLKLILPSLKIKRQILENIIALTSFSLPTNSSYYNTEEDYIDAEKFKDDYLKQCTDKCDTQKCRNLVEAKKLSFLGCRQRSQSEDNLQSNQSEDQDNRFKESLSLATEENSDDNQHTENTALTWSNLFPDTVTMNHFLCFAKEYYIKKACNEFTHFGNDSYIQKRCYKNNYIYFSRGRFFENQKVLISLG